MRVREHREVRHGGHGIVNRTSNYIKHGPKVWLLIMHVKIERQLRQFKIKTSRLQANPLTRRGAPVSYRRISAQNS